MYSSDRSMVYQVQHKEYLAEFLNLPLNYFYNLSYQDWRQISERYKAFTDEAEVSFRDCFDSVPEFKDFTNKTEFRFIYAAYKQHVDNNGGNVKAETLGRM